MFKDNNKLYNYLPNNGFLTRIGQLDIPFDRTWKRIGVNLSGGADSALLMYLLCKIIIDNKLDTKIDVITYQRCWETRPWQGHISRKVYMWFLNNFAGIISKRHTAYIPPELEHGVIGPIVNGRSGDQIIVGSFNRFAAWEHKFDAIFNATSMNFDDGRSDRMKNRHKEATAGNLLDVWTPNKGVDTIFVLPFKFVKKDWIVAQYHIQKITDLYNLTRSCEGDINHHDIVKAACNSFKDYTEGMYIPTCGQCWWCEERAWAEAQVQKTITEILNEL